MQRTGAMWKVKQVVLLRRKLFVHLLPAGAFTHKKSIISSIGNFSYYCIALVPAVSISIISTSISCINSKSMPCSEHPNAVPL